MCYFLYIASPLTLSEIRAMLPEGLTADAASPAQRAALQRVHPKARTVALLLVGACSCDLVRPRLDNPIEDERDLRARYQGRKLSRAEIIRELERHRRGPLPRPLPESGWAEALAGFVVEHARNAGSTLYLLDFGPHPPDTEGGINAAPLDCSVDQVRQGRTPWLVEGRPVLVR
jgi:hypothetical protein